MVNLVETYKEQLYKKYAPQINPDLDRKLVSFQANYAVPFYSWFKYKEAFSAELVHYLLATLNQKTPGLLYDPFAGTGTALFAAAEASWRTKGIELLPV